MAFSCLIEFALPYSKAIVVSFPLEITLSYLTTFSIQSKPSHPLPPKGARMGNLSLLVLLCFRIVKELFSHGLGGHAAIPSHEGVPAWWRLTGSNR